PEQATGDRLIDARSDIYALATVLYEMLAGEPPLTGPPVRSVIAKVVTDRARPLRQLRESVPPHVEAAVVKALAKVRADRFQTAAQFAEALVRPTLATTAPDVAAAAPGRFGGLALREVAPWAIAGLATGLALWVALRPRPERGLVLGATWGESDTIVFRSDKGLMTVAAAGGEPRLLLQADSSRGESYLFPHYLPDAKALLLQIRSEGIDRLGALALATGKLTRFTQLGSNPRYVSSGHVVLATRSGTLLAVPFDQSRLTITGAAVPVADGVVVGPGGAARLGMSLDGAFAYVSAPAVLRELVMGDRAGGAR